MLHDIALYKFNIHIHIHIHDRQQLTAALLVDKLSYVICC